MISAHASALLPAQESASMDAWLAWFARHQQAACRAYLCTRYHLDTLDAEALINAAQLQVCLHWATLEHPLAYFWQTLKHEVEKQGQRRARERRQLAVYARQQQLQAHGAARTTQHVADVLARVSSHQRRLLEWFAQGYADVEVAAWLQTTPQAVRRARHGAYGALRTQLCPPSSRQAAASPTNTPEKNFEGAEHLAPLHGSL
jgi:DNA-binding NarL/FixJ family response regulator